MKKLASFALSFALCAACAVSAFAADTTSGTANATSGTTTITTNIQPSYLVVIPADTAIAFNATSTTLTPELGLSKAQLHPGYKVKVTATVNPLENKKDPSKTIPFTLHKADDTAFESAAFTNTTDKVQLSVHISETSWNTAPAGSYTGSITFTITYTNEAG